MWDRIGQVYLTQHLLRPGPTGFGKQANKQEPCDDACARGGIIEVSPIIIGRYVWRGNTKSNDDEALGHSQHDHRARIDAAGCNLKVTHLARNDGRLRLISLVNEHHILYNQRNQGFHRPGAQPHQSTRRQVAIQ